MCWVRVSWVGVHSIDLGKVIVLLSIVLQGVRVRVRVRFRHCDPDMAICIPGGYTWGMSE